MESDESHAVLAQEHASVTGHGYRFLNDTVWAKRRSIKALTTGLLAVPFLMFANGEALNASPVAWTVGWQDFAARVGGEVAQNGAFAHWQLLWWQGNDLDSLQARFGSPL